MLFVTYNKSEKSTSEGEAGTTGVDSRNLSDINGDNDKKVEGEEIIIADEQEKIQSVVQEVDGSFFNL